MNQWKLKNKIAKPEKSQSQFVDDIDVHALHRFWLNMAAKHLLLRAHLRLCTVLRSGKGDID